MPQINYLIYHLPNFKKMENSGSEDIIKQGYKGDHGFGSKWGIYNEDYLSDRAKEEGNVARYYLKPSKYFVGVTKFTLTIKHNGYIVDSKTVEMGGETPKADLECNGDISWKNVKIDDNNVFTSSFEIENICKEGIYGAGLDWKVVSFPSWGKWNINPSSSNEAQSSLVAGSSITVNVVLYGSLNNRDYTGEIRVENSNNPEDYDIVHVSLTVDSSNSNNDNQNDDNDDQTMPLDPVEEDTLPLDPDDEEIEPEPPEYNDNLVYQLTVTIDGGDNSYTPSVNPISGNYEPGTHITIIASPEDKFIGWSGDASGSNNQITINMDSDKTIIANFAKSINNW